MAAVDTEIAVIGAGIAGLATAHVLAGGGRRVTVIEQFTVGHDRGSSHGASRVFRLSYPTAAWVRRAQEALRGWRRLESELGESLVRRTGSLDVGSYADENRRALDACGAAAEMITAEDARRHWGLALPDTLVLHQRDAGVISSARTLELLAAAVAGAGAEVRTGCRVLAIRQEPDGVALETSLGPMKARAAVVTAGAWSRRLVAPLGIDLPVVATRETVAFAAVDDADALPVLVIAERPEHTRREIATYVLADDPTTLKIGVHQSGPVAEPDADGTPDASTVEWALAFVAQRLSGRTVHPAGAQTCLYTNTTDEEFVLERHGRVVVGSACSGHAFKFAPSTGMTLARLAGDAAAAA